MPIGKNALKRVTNNGYSKVSVSAPDMEHSEIIETPKKEEIKKVASLKEEPKKNTAPKTKKAPVKKPEVKKVKDKNEASRPDGFLRYGLGSELPVHLL